MSSNIEIKVDVKEAYRRGFVFNHLNENNYCYLSGPKDKMTDANIAKVLDAVAEFFIARRDNINAQIAFDQEITLEEQKNDPNNYYVQRANQTWSRLQNSLKALDSAHENTGLETRY